jgi:hypothetical protein
MELLQLILEVISAIFSLLGVLVTPICWFAKIVYNIVHPDLPEVLTFEEEQCQTSLFTELSSKDIAENTAWKDKSFLEKQEQSHLSDSMIWGLSQD